MIRRLNKIKIENNEHGMALVTVMMVLVVVSVMGVSLMGLAASNTKMTTGERDTQSSYYIAESGINARLNELSSLIRTEYNNAVSGPNFFSRVENLFVEKNYGVETFEKSLGHQPSATVKIQALNTTNSFSKDYKITSSGVINGKSSSVSAIFNLTWKPKSNIVLPPDSVLFTDNELIFQNTPVTLNGEVVSNGLIKITGSKTIIGEDQINENARIPMDIPEFPAFEAPSSPVFTGNTLTLDRDKSFNKISVPANTTLTINTENKNRIIVLDMLEVGTNGKIVISGTGKLSLYVKRLNTQTGSVINYDQNIINIFSDPDKKYLPENMDKIQQHINKLYLFLDGPGLTLNSGWIFGSIFAKQADITINNDNGIQGHVITLGSLVVLNQPSTMPKLVFAPYAAIDARQTFAGTIIGSEFKSSGNNHQFILQSARIDYENSPFFIDDGSIELSTKDIFRVDPVREGN
ncbi:PilX N-terminal domain-containing pilus assembly protein [Neobacillus sp. 3P2-tot-E-2]|uniref:PilX N-terminal domain-containing pilus assembly protein n=1 Tax=Neobacillus sp. 3P2-tot-E-2 TaxID=3132212 RepID=UPI0039A309D4